LLSLAFDVVKSIILGGPQADYFRKVKQELDAQPALHGGASLALAKKAVTVRHRAPASALEKAAKELRAQLGKLDQLSLAEEDAHALHQAIDEFRAFGADRWVAATSHLVLALKVLGHSSAGRRPRKRKAAKPPRERKPATKLRERKPTTKPKAPKLTTKRRPRKAPKPVRARKR
jgi:hypothetical protein